MSTKSHPARPAVEVLRVPKMVVDEILVKTEPVLVDFEQRILHLVVRSYYELTEQLRRQDATLARLRRFAGMLSSERTRDVLDPCGATAGGIAPPAGAAAPPPAAPPASAATPPAPAADTGPHAPPRPEAKKKGHGRVPAKDYTDAKCIPVLHDDLRPGEVCPLCGQGRLYELATPAPILRIVGQAPLAAICWSCARLRCGGCGHVFTARAPEAAQGSKYDETAVSMMALLRYGAGLPQHRLEHLERNLATPVPASTQWDVVNERVSDVRPVFDELSHRAAQGQIIHNDDSYARILAFMGKRRAALLARGELPDPERTGIFTTAIVSVVEHRPIALFFTGRKHAGENLAALLKQRAADLSSPVLMSDALDRNVPKGHAVIEANCLAHGRRNVIDEVASFPKECERILVSLKRVFRVDHLCRRHGLSPEQRLHVHQRWSSPVMGQLEAWMSGQFTTKQVEPNSGLGQAMNYLLKRWEKITCFLRVIGAPLENNICERALKMAIRHRNNSLFYKSQRGAEVGDIYMTLVHTTELHGENPFTYLTTLHRNARAVADNPAEWLPWNYREALARLGARNAHHEVIPVPPAACARPRTHAPARVSAPILAATAVSAQAAL